MKTYYAAKALEIQSHKIAQGDVIGTGDVDKGEFTPAKGLEKAVACGHVIPRLAIGLITSKKVAPEPPAKGKADPKKNGKKVEPETDPAAEDPAE